jgi:hypothetical protein
LAGRLLVANRGLLLAAAIVACAGEKAAVKTASQPNPPGWLAKAPSSSDTLFFSGAREGSSSLEEGKDSALEGARSQAAQYIGVEISAEHSDVMSTEEAENKAKDTVKSRATAMVRSAEVTDVYYEKISRPVGSGMVDRFDVWVLIKLPRAELQKERERQAQESHEGAASALSRYREGQMQEKGGASLAALVRYRDAIGKLKGIGGSVPTGDAQIASAGKLLTVLQDAAARAQGKVRRAIVVAPDWIAGAVTQALSAKGFSAQTQSGPNENAALQQARAQGTPYVIVVHASTTPGGRVFSQVAAMAALDVRALDAQTGAVVASTQKQEKGFGRTQRAAQDDAASKAGLGAGNDLATALVAKESSDL